MVCCIVIIVPVPGLSWVVYCSPRPSCKETWAVCLLFAFWATIRFQWLVFGYACIVQKPRRIESLKEFLTVFTFENSDIDYWKKLGQLNKCLRDLSKIMVTFTRTVLTEYCWDVFLYISDVNNAKYDHFCYFLCRQKETDAILCDIWPGTCFQFVVPYCPDLFWYVVSYYFFQASL